MMVRINRGNENREMCEAVAVMALSYLPEKLRT